MYIKAPRSTKKHQVAQKTLKSIKKNAKIIFFKQSQTFATNSMDYLIFSKNKVND